MYGDCVGAAVVEQMGKQKPGAEKNNEEAEEEHLDPADKNTHDIATDAV